MIDIAAIKAHYAGMEDGQLINIAVQDAHHLTPEAFQLLQQEFEKRKLDPRYIESAEQTKREIHEEKMEAVRNSADDDFTKAIWEYVIEEKENDSGNDTILAGLQERGLSPEQAVSLLENLDTRLKETISQKDTKMLVGAFFLTAGIFITMWSYSQAVALGGSYYIAWGAVVFGAIRFIMSIGEKRKFKRLLKKINSEKK